MLVLKSVALFVDLDRLQRGKAAFSCDFSCCGWKHQPPPPATTAPLPLLLLTLQLPIIMIIIIMSVIKHFSAKNLLGENILTSLQQ